MGDIAIKEVIKQPLAKRGMAQAMTYAWQNVPLFVQMFNANAENLIKTKKELGYTYNDIIIKCMVNAVKKVPQVNSTLDGKNWVIYEDINVGVAIISEHGLYVPVIKKANNMTVQEISEAVCKIEDDFAEIEKMYGASPLWTAISDKFKETKDKSKTLVYAAQIERQHSEEQKRAEAIQQAREEQARAEAAQNALREPEAPQAVTQPEIVQNVAQANPAASERLIRGKFLVEGTKDQIKALAAFLKNTGIRYEVIK